MRTAATSVVEWISALSLPVRLWPLLGHGRFRRTGVRLPERRDPAVRPRDCR
ncbi:hypothetical protein [Streptomyces sp. NPDC002644]